jgi:hypothetical protein
VNAIESLLKLLDWQLFVTLTWSDANMQGVEGRAKRVQGFLNELSKRRRCLPCDLPTVIRWERGESGDRPHCHLLITGFPSVPKPTRDFCFRMQHWWFMRNGLARVRLWHAELRSEAASYLGKRLDGSDSYVTGRFSSGNEYEVAKFDHADRLVFNKALWRTLQRKTGTSFVVAPTT